MTERARPSRLLAWPLLAAALFSLGACTLFVRTAPPDAMDVRAVPPDRILAYAAPAPGTGQVVVTRDAGALGGGCYLAVMAGTTLVARLDTEEQAVIWLPVGPNALAVAADPQGRGLCAINGFTPVVETHQVVADGITRLRLSLGAYRRPRLTEDTGASRR